MIPGRPCVRRREGDVGSQRGDPSPVGRSHEVVEAMVREYPNGDEVARRGPQLGPLARGDALFRPATGRDEQIARAANLERDTLGPDDDPGEAVRRGEIEGRTRSPDHPAIAEDDDVVMAKVHPSPRPAVQEVRVRRDRGRRVGVDGGHDDHPATGQDDESLILGRNDHRPGGPLANAREAPDRTAHRSGREHQHAGQGQGDRACSGHLLKGPSHHRSGSESGSPAPLAWSIDRW